MTQITGIEVQLKAARQAEADANRLDKSLDRLGKSGTKAEGTFDRLRRESTKMGTGFEGLKRHIFSLQGALATLGVGIGFGSAINEIASFGREMSVVQAVSRATASDMEKLTATARDLGATTAFSASEAAQGLVALSQAGFSAEQSLAAIRDTLNLAAAGGIGLGEAADLATNTLSQFNLAANEAGRVADVLADAAARSNTTVGQLGIAMRQVGPVAASVGVSFENTTAAISSLSDAGLKGEQAGTGLRAVLASLVDPSKEAAGVIERLGVNVSDLSDPAQVFEQFGKAGMTAQDAVKIFGREAAAAGLILAGASDKVAELADEFRNAEGAAAQMAKTMEDNLGGDIKTLSSAMSELILQTGDKGLTGALRSATQAFTGLIRTASGATTFTEFRNEFALFADTTSILAVAIGGRLVAGLGAAIASMGTATTAATALRAALALLGGPVGIAITAAGTLAILASRQSATAKAADESKTAHDKLKEALDLVEKATGDAKVSAENHAFALARQKMEALDTAQAQLKLVEAQIQATESLASWEKLKGAAHTGPIQAEAQALRDRVKELNDEIERARELAAASGRTITLETVPVEGTTPPKPPVTPPRPTGIVDADKTIRDLTAMEKAQSKFNDAIRNYPAQQAVRDLEEEFRAQEKAFTEGARLQEEAQDKVNRKLEESKQFVRDLGLTFSSSFEEAILKANSLSDVLRGLAKDILAISTRKLITNPFAAAIGDIAGGLGGLFGGGTAAPTAPHMFGPKVRFAHQGGIIGVDAMPMRSVSPSIFDNAPRLHNGGLLSGEIPAVLKRGEEVLPANHPRHQNNRSTNGPTNITVQNHYTIDARGAGPGVSSEIRAALDMTEERSVARSEAQIMRSITRGGAFAKATGRA